MLKHLQNLPSADSEDTFYFDISRRESYQSSQPMDRKDSNAFDEDGADMNPPTIFNESEVVDFDALEQT